MVSVFLVDEYEITKVALRSVLTGETRLVADHGIEGAFEAIMAAMPDVCLVDIAAGGGTGCGIDLLRRLSQEAPSIKLAAFTALDSDQDVFGALQAGAIGYIHKSVALKDLPTAIAAINWGAAWLSPNVARRILAGTKDAMPVQKAPSEDPMADLTPREKDVLELIGQGLSNRQIGERLCLSSETVKTHVRHIMEKLAVNSRTQIAIQVCRSGRFSAA